MSVYIGSARKDERGQYHGGKAGDQTGIEVSTQEWYAHGKTWVLLRAKSATAREKIAKAMESACANPYIGYDQWDRNTLWKAAAKVGYDTAKVDTPVETDCSGLVRVCCAYAGIVMSDFNTTTEANRLMATGEFEKYTDAKYTQSPDYLLRGDILVTATKGHTVVVLSDGDKTKPAPAPVKKVDPSPYDKNPDYNKWYTTTGNVYMRYGVGTSKEKMVVMPKGTRFRCYGFWNKNTDGRVWLLGVANVNGKEYTGWASTLYLK